MIKTEFYREREDGVKLYRTYSDTNMLIRQEPTDIEYTEAIDIENAQYTYTETTTPITSEEITPEEALNILLGGDINE